MRSNKPSGSVAAGRNPASYRLRAGIAGLLGILIFAPGAAMAKNFCISGFPNPAWVLVGQGFVIPPKGKCKPWTGFNTEVGNAPSAGVGCTSSDGANLALTVTTTSGPIGFAEIDAVSLALPSRKGSWAGQFMAGSAVTTSKASSGISGAICTTNAISPNHASPQGSLGYGGAGIPVN